MTSGTLPSMRRKLMQLSAKVSVKARKVMGVFREDEIDRVLGEMKSKASAGSVEGLRIVITGSTRGVGLTIAGAFASKGAKVLINGRDEKALAAAVKTLRQQGFAEGCCCDVSKPEGAKQLLDEAIRLFGQVDILINNAGVSGPTTKGAWEVDPQEWTKVIDANLNGPFYCTQAFTRWMVEHGHAGRIIQVSTGAAHGGQKLFTPYVASKCGLEAMAHNFAMDVGNSGVVVTTIRVGSVQTDMTRAVLGWEKYQMLPPPEIVVPAFLHAATAEPSSVHGRTLATWRFLADPQAEAILNSSLALTPRFTFHPPVVPKDVPESEFILLERAENQLGTPPKVHEFLQRQVANPPALHRYPDFECRELRAGLSRRLKLPMQCFSFGNGSTEIIERILRVFVPPGEEVISSNPSWFMFDRMCVMFGLENCKVPIVREAQGTFGYSLDGVSAAIGPRTRLIYLVSPSNPVGCILRHSEFMAFLEKVPPHIPVLVDEAYVEYADDPQMLQTHLAVQETNRLVFGLRTFSKFFGLAGCRVGYAFGSERAINLLARWEMPLNIPTLSCGAATAALSDEEFGNRVRKNLQEEKARIEAFLKSRKLDFIPTQTNMILVECPGKPEAFYERSQARGIFNPKSIWLDKYTHFPISIPSHNDRNMQLFESFL